jgi:2-keto-4-pentenoate hydratase/2-oxohepta-3-ene-1,7-dioic acid hydratase in catechol pathway
VRLYRYMPEPARGSEPRLAIRIEDAPAVDLLAAWGQARGGADPRRVPFLTSPLLFIEEGPERWAEVRDIVRAARGEPGVDLQEVHLLAPLDRVPSLRDFLTFEDHVLRGAQRRGVPVPSYWYEAPIYYKGNHRSIIGPDSECPWPSFTQRLDFELELAMIVGGRGRDVAAENAGSFIFGFSVLDDFSARDVQAREMTAWLGPAKGKDFATALGPCIVTADEVGTEPDLEMICRVNDEEWGRARSGSARWRWADMIAHVSKDEDIYAGDVYGSGTPGGCCGLDLGRELTPGDVVELEIEKIGVLRNTIGPRP